MTESPSCYALPRCKYGLTLPSMAVTKVKSTYSLDVESVRTLEELARRWGVSKSEVLRQAIRSAAATARSGEAALSALDRLQASVRRRKLDVAHWEGEIAAERHAVEERLTHQDR